MNKPENLARVILRPDGTVHIAFRDIRSIYATAPNLLELFSDPIDFINNKSFTYKESTFEINRNRVVLEEVLGLTLATVSSDKQIVCDFPELFQYVFSLIQENNSQPLNMKSFEFETVLSDEKSFLLRYYLEFTNQLTSVLTIKNNIKLRNEIQSEIIREILNTFFIDTLPEKTKVQDIAATISQAESSVVFEASKPEIEMVSVIEYARFWNLSPQTVRNYINQGRFENAYRNSLGHFMINKTEKPLDWDLRKGRKKKKSSDEKMYKRRSKGSAEEVREHILKLNWFSAKIAPYIHTYEELDYYTKRHYHEVCWDGRPALIIDVNPDYISNDGISNRELMLAGKAPHIPDRNKDEYVYHIHHIGQHTTSPFAIIPEYDHNGANYSSFFHQATPNAELHGPEFEALKINFWKNYLKKYDEAGSFNGIEYSNHQSKRKLK